MMGVCLPNEWLIRKTSLEEILKSRFKEEEDFKSVFPNVSRKKKGKRQKSLENQLIERKTRWETKWNEFIEDYQATDEIWEYSTPFEDWENLMGQSGYARVRDGKVLKTLVLRMN